MLFADCCNSQFRPTRINPAGMFSFSCCILGTVLFINHFHDFLHGAYSYFLPSCVIVYELGEVFYLLFFYRFAALLFFFYSLFQAFSNSLLISLCLLAPPAMFPFFNTLSQIFDGNLAFLLMKVFVEDRSVAYHRKVVAIMVC